CGQFPTGGGREAAAGINALRKEDVNAFIDAVETYYA
ncbi:DHH family phosphoesterase, partial [Vibrio alginolyticus]|nr:DHH family phosphoesterase [Vibrio alginolyticus]MDW2199774.1 DHH family phosphoesterase [Vibrio sp. 2084]